MTAAAQMTSSFLIPRYLLDLDQYNSNEELTGVPTGQNGQPYPEIMYQQQVRTSIARVEKEFDLVVNDLILVSGERHSDIDYQTANFVPFTMDKRPVREIVRVEVQVGNFPPTVVPLSWWEIVNHDLGQVRLMPSQQSWSVTAQGSVVMLMTQLRYQPGIWRFTYKAGWDGIANVSSTYALGSYAKPAALVGQIQVTPSAAPASGKQFDATFTGVDGAGLPITETLTWLAGDASEQQTSKTFAAITLATFTATGGTPTFTVTPVPVYPLDEDIVDIVGNWATFGISDISGDLLGGSGIASFSRSQDGLSTNVNTTSSPENHGFSAKQKQQRLRIKELAEGLRRRFSMPGIASL